MTVNRLLWLFYRIVRKILRIVTGDTNADGIKHVRVSGNLSKQELSLIIEKIRWYAPDSVIFYIKSEYAAYLPENVRLNEPSMPDFYLLTKISHIFSHILVLHKCEVVDPEFYSTEECVAWSYLYGKVVGISDEIREQSAENFRNMQNRLKSRENACCFLTGQSFSEFRNHPETKDMVKIICNSVVKNDEFLEFNNPDILTFADPVYHFSFNEYSVNFRKDVIKTAEKHDIFIIIPQNMLPLMIVHYPNLKNRLIGIERGSNFNFPTPEDPKVKTTDNILTYFMLPIASALCNEIYLLGADGRGKNDKMFWKHNSAVQYDSLMQSVVDAHPSFFRDRNYVQYQDNHDDLMESLFKYGESQGKKYISLNSSNLNSISARYKGENNVA